MLILKSMWRRLWDNVLGIALVFALLFAAIRGIGMLGPPSYRIAIPIGFVLMMLLPFIFLTKAGRTQIGLVRSKNLRSYSFAVLYGVIAPSICFVAGLLLFDMSPDNWFITIRNYYNAQVPGGKIPLTQLFIVVTIPAMIFSPIGEEVFFRGFLQEALNTRFSLRASTILESLMFGIVHLFHHGLVSINGKIQFYPVSAILWVILMFFTAYGFAAIRKQSGSIYPAMVSHAVFNVVMNIYIFKSLM